VNKAVANAIRNLGSLMTIEDRRDRELRKFLPEETVRKLRGYDVQSTVGDPELEGILRDVFDR
jgi:hypothetical protein